MEDKNVILITIDCLRFDHLGCYGYQKNISPFIDSLASEGIKYTNAFSNGPFTIASFPSILASIYPLDYGRIIPFPKTPKLMSETLQRSGVKTIGINSNPYLTKFYGYERGWDEFIDYITKDKSTKNEKIKTKDNINEKNRLLKNINKKIPSLIKENEYVRLLSHVINYSLLNKSKKVHEDASIITKDAIEMIKKYKNDSFFMWIHFMDAHEPYLEKPYHSSLTIAKTKLKKEKKTISKKELKTLYKQSYNKAISLIDKNIEKLVSHLKYINKKTIIIITSDHGQQFWEHDSFGHYAHFFEELIHIPLIIYGENYKNKTREELVQLIDIPPTILSYFDIEPPKTYKGIRLDNKNKKRDCIIIETYHDENFDVRNKKGDLPPLKTYALRTKKWKFIFGDNRRKLFNLISDPSEKKNLYHQEKVLTNYFQKILKDHIRKQKNLKEKEDVKRKIEKLKYLKKI